MKKALIIDDESLARDIIREYLKSFPQVEIAGECVNGFDGVKAIQSLEPDLVFLDVQMPKLNGFEMLELLDDLPPVIFTTAFDEFAIKAFDLNAVDYLLKPFSRERFDTAMRKWLDGKSEPEEKLRQAANDLGAAAGVPLNRIVVKNEFGISIIPAGDIHYLEAFDDYVKIFTAKGFHLKKQTLSHYEKTLDPEYFFRTHRSYMLNLGLLTSLEPYGKNSYFAVLRDGKKIPVSRNAYTQLRLRLGI
jgi:two-component system LytT family response regulator